MSPFSGSCSLIVAVAALCSACGDGRSSAAAARDSAGAAATSTPAAQGSATPTVNDRWIGPYQLRGQLEGGRSVTGTLTLTPLESGTPDFTTASTRVRQTYPSYEGPYYSARMELATSADSLRGTFSCAHGPSQPPPLVCHPTSPIAGLENATLVMQPAGRAILTGSHGEGVSVEFGRFSWTAAGS